MEVLLMGGRELKASSRFNRTVVFSYHNFSTLPYHGGCF